jgi:membrane fusion protein (multidrug efflux system)
LSLGKQIVVALALLLALVVGGYWYNDYAGTHGADAAVQRQQKIVPVELAAAVAQTLADRIEAVGTSLARQAVEIVPLTSGRVAEIAFRPGQMVEAGAVLVRLDETSEQAGLAAAEAELREAQLALERGRRLESNNTVAKATVDQLEAQFLAAQARVEGARKQLADRTIRAPFAGIIGLQQVDIGARVDDSTVLTTLDDLAEIEVDFVVPEIFFGAVRAGQRAVATSVAFPGRRFVGEVASIDSRIDRVARAFHVRALLANPDLTLPAGMFMHVELIVAEREALTIPEEAVIVADRASYVFTLEDERAVRRDVVLGKRQAGRVEVTEGLAAGERVVIRGIQQLRDGTLVRIEGTAPAEPPAALPAQASG